MAIFEFATRFLEAFSFAAGIRRETTATMRAGAVDFRQPGPLFDIMFF